MEKRIRSIKYNRVNNNTRIGRGRRSIYVKPKSNFYPARFTVVIIAIAIFKVYDYLTSRYNKFSKVIVPDPILLVKDGKIIDESMEKARISRKELGILYETKWNRRYFYY